MGRHQDRQDFISAVSVIRRFVQLVRAASAAGWSRVQIKRDPVKYARRLGVQLGDGVHFYDAHIGMFSTEPWLIRMGSDVHVTSGVQFVTHDGGTLVLRHRTPDLEITAPITVGDRVYIGMNSLILALCVRLR